VAQDKFLLLFLLLRCSSLFFGSELDIQCLKSVQQSVVDARGVLKSSWDFANSTNGLTCRFTGVECWHQDDRVYALHLGNLGLEGRFPQSLQYCTSMSMLDLRTCQITSFQDRSLLASHGVCGICHLWIFNSINFQVKSQIVSQIWSLTSLNLQHNQWSYSSCTTEV
jgi:hypothetical protein